MVFAHSHAAGSMMRSHLACGGTGLCEGCVVRRWWRACLLVEKNNLMSSALSSPIRRSSRSLFAVEPTIRDLLSTMDTTDQATEN
jgi:hypothetical protein